MVYRDSLLKNVIILVVTGILGRGDNPRDMLIFQRPRISPHVFGPTNCAIKGCTVDRIDFLAIATRKQQQQQHQQHPSIHPSILSTNHPTTQPANHPINQAIKQSIKATCQAWPLLKSLFGFLIPRSFCFRRQVVNAKKKNDAQTTKVKRDPGRHGGFFSFRWATFKTKPPWMTFHYSQDPWDWYICLP